MTNHQKRLQRITAALDAANLTHSLCNDLIDRMTTLYVQTSRGRLSIYIRQPGLNRPAFRVGVEHGELMFDPPADVLADLERRYAGIDCRSGFTADFDIDQTDLLTMIQGLKPHYVDNVRDIRQPGHTH